MFAARVNDLDSIQRVRVSDDDTAGLASDYIDQRPITNDLAIITPYVVKFRCFTPELARVVSGFATSPNPFIVKSVTAQPASATTNPEGTGEAGANPNPYPAANPYAAGTIRYAGGMDPRYRRGFVPGQTPNPDQPQAGQPATAKGGLQTVLKEQLLRITLEVEIVKLLPK